MPIFRRPCYPGVFESTGRPLRIRQSPGKLALSLLATSQYELARYVGVPQANIAFRERSEKPPRSDVLPKMAEALGVTVEDLLIVEKRLKKKAAKSNGRPVGKVREVFDRVSKLPRRQQEHIVN